MADYAKVSIKGVFSKNSDHSFPKVSFAPDAKSISATEYRHMEMTATNAGLTVTTSTFSSIDMLMVKNNDATDFVTAAFRSAGNTTTPNVIRIAAGGFLVVTDFTVANNLTLTGPDSEGCECEIFIVGS